MKWTSVASFALVSLLQGQCHARRLWFHLPDDLDDGRYTITFKDGKVDQEPTLERYNLTEADAMLKGKKHPRLVLPRGVPDPENKVPTYGARIPVSGSGCSYDDTPLDPDDYWASKQSLGNFCDDHFAERVRIDIALHGSVKVWVCAIDKWTRCARWEYREAEHVFNRTCGEDQGAWTSLKSWGRVYGRSPRHLPIHCEDFV
ncbi:hypothetical protein EDB81DRAFT_752943 [Dactylonectria macrodidyma]|uniref:Uncharacterized protein n=1 Tax=Dactylonectria macrodidyma TaxID=307937 RepID=A0A9P9JLE6_9HYPO|nr:hypothetical protein EDB81DRAFT_752943 [Dactylonectria macrodidyma]